MCWEDRIDSKNSCASKMVWSGPAYRYAAKSVHVLVFVKSGGCRLAQHTVVLLEKYPADSFSSISLPAILDMCKHVKRVMRST